MLYQVYSRNNDVNGNPYRLVVTYTNKGEVSEVFEARSSSPNIVRTLDSLTQNYITRKIALIEPITIKDNEVTPKYGRTFHALPLIHLSPNEYNMLKKQLTQHRKLRHSH